MGKEKIELLLIEDNPGDVHLIRTILVAEEPTGFTVTVADRLAQGISLLERKGFDALLLDLSLPDSTGLKTLQTMLQAFPDCPVVVLTGLDDRDIGLQALKEGAQDYLVKGEVSGRLLARVISYAIERKQIEVEREQLIADLDAFAHTVAHDLKTPLQVFGGYSEILSEQWDSMPHDHVTDALQEMCDQSAMMRKIIDELLLMASIRKSDVTIGHLDMAQIFSAARRRVKQLIESRQAQIILPETWPVALGYGPWIEEVWVNYLGNAVEHGGDPPIIELGATEIPGQEVCFWIQNNGPCFPPELEEQFFQPFNRFSRPAKGGHGLGLSIVRRIVEKLDGSVDGERRSEGGARFSFTLPAP